MDTPLGFNSTLRAGERVSVWAAAAGFAPAAVGSPLLPLLRLPG